MSTSLKNAVIELAYGKSVAFKDARDACLVCTDGALWLTVAGEFRDFLLIKGERLRIGSNGLAIIQGLPFASAQLVGTTTR